MAPVLLSHQRVPRWPGIPPPSRRETEIVRASLKEKLTADDVGWLSDGRVLPKGHLEWACDSCSLAGVKTADTHSQQPGGGHTRAQTGTAPSVGVCKQLDVRLTVAQPGQPWGDVNTGLRDMTSGHQSCATGAVSGGWHHYLFIHLFSNEYPRGPPMWVAYLCRSLLLRPS